MIRLKKRAEYQPIEIEFSFTADLFSCINHKCRARVSVDPRDPKEFEVIWWSDGYSEYEDFPNQGVYDSLAEEVDYQCFLSLESKGAL